MEITDGKRTVEAPDPCQQHAFGVGPDGPGGSLECERCGISDQEPLIHNGREWVWQRVSDGTWALHSEGQAIRWIDRVPTSGGAEPPASACATDQ